MDFERRVTMGMACGIILISFAYLFLVTFATVSETGEDHAKTIVGFLIGSGLSIFFGYYWGSSKGSADRSRTIDRMVEGPTIDNPVPPKPKPEVKP